MSSRAAADPRPACGPRPDAAPDPEAPHPPQVRTRLADRRLADRSGLCHRPDTAVPQAPGLCSHQQPPLPLVQMREQHRELHGELVTSLIRDAHTTPASLRAGSNTLIPCKPLACPCSVRNRNCCAWVASRRLQLPYGECQQRMVGTGGRAEACCATCEVHPTLLEPGARRLLGASGYVAKQKDHGHGGCARVDGVDAVLLPLT